MTINVPVHLKWNRNMLSSSIMLSSFCELSRRGIRNCVSAVAVAVITLLTSANLIAATPRPNVVYIMADELGYFELSHMGHPNIQTPHIDAMAAEGIRFTQALAGSSLCAPTRCVLMTGKHSGHTSVRTNGGGTPLRKGEPTIASMLKTDGYATGGFGKWGCGGRGSTGVPEQHGFDLFVGYYDQVHAHSYYPKYILRNSAEYPLTDNEGGSTGQTYSHYTIFNEAKNFIRANRDQPFFCYLPVTPPHGLFDIPDDDPAWQVYKDKDWPEEARRYAAMITMLDRHVGEVLALLKELRLDENTLVFFCGDNGGNDYFKSPERSRGFHKPNVDPVTGVEFRGTKGTLYEGGLRIPMIARWPGKIEPGQVSDLLWYFPDVMATVADVTSTSAPNDTYGISILPTLIGEQAAGEPQQHHEYLYWELGSQVAVRMDNWKALRRGTQRWELYDLDTDVSETTSVADQYPQVLQKMTTFASEAHEEAVEGVFENTELHERDRRAKFGGRAPAPRRTRKQVHALNPSGLVPFRKLKLISVSSENTANQKHASNAIDGDPTTIWHTQWSGELQSHPHHLTIDLGEEYLVSGFRYLARQDEGWNGAIRKCTFQVSHDSQNFGSAGVKAVFSKSKESQEVTCPSVSARYVRIVIESEVNGGPWASIAELGVVGSAVRRGPTR